MVIGPDIDPHTLPLEKKILLVQESDGLLIELLEGEHIEGDLSLYGCTSLTHLPEDLSVEGDLDLGGCSSLTHLPEDLSVGGYLYLGGCSSLKGKITWR